jgi:hypothetical protein
MRASILPVLAALLLASCGGDSMTSPSNTARIEGTVNSPTGVTAQSGRSSSAATNITVSVVGANISTTTDSAGHFVLEGITSDHVTLRFQGPGIDANLTISGLVAGQTLTISVQVSGNQAVRNDDDDQVSAGSCPAVGNKAEIEGNIVERTSTSITVFQQGKGNFLAQVTSTTTIRHGNKTFTSDDLKIGDHVHVSGQSLGMMNGVCTVGANEIKIQ